MRDGTETLSEKRMTALEKNECGMRPLCFRVTPDFHYAFKRAALDRRISMSELLQEIWQSWEKHGAHRAGNRRATDQREAL